MKLEAKAVITVVKKSEVKKDEKETKPNKDN
jgi:hypothetical protein